MAVDRVTIPASGDWTPTITANDTIIAKGEGKNINLKRPDLADGREITIYFENSGAEITINCDLRNFAAIDKAYGFFPHVANKNPVMVRLFCSETAGTGEAGAWLITACETVRDSVHAQIERVRFDRVISNTGWVTFNELTSDADIITALHDEIDGIRASANHTIELALRDMDAPAAQINLDNGSAFVGDAPDGTLRIYQTLKNMSYLVTAGTSYTISVSVEGGPVQTTGSLAVGALATTIVAALEALPNVGEGNVYVQAYSANRQIVFSPTLGYTVMTATGASVGLNHGETLILESTTADGITVANTAHNVLIHYNGLLWRPTIRFNLVVRSEFTGADLTDAVVLHQFKPSILGHFTAQNLDVNTVQDTYRTQYVLIAETPTTFPIPDQGQMLDIKRRGTTLDYYNTSGVTHTLERMGMDLIRRGGAISRTLTLAPGESVRLVGDGKYYNAVDGMSFTEADRGLLTNAAIAAGEVNAKATTVLDRIGAWTGTARNTILGAFQALFRKDVDATVPSDINTNLGSGAGAANNTTDSTEAIRDRGDAAWVSGAGGTGNGDVAVNHDYGGDDALRILSSASAPVDNAVIRAYVTSDYAAGTIDPEPPTTTTGSDGRWTAPLMLDADTYTLSVFNPDTNRTKSFSLVVTEP